jgi:hypothetical protein
MAVPGRARPHQPTEGIQVLRRRNTVSAAAADRGATNGKLADITTGTAAASPVNGHAIERPRPSAQEQEEVRKAKKAIAWKYKQRQRQRDPDAVSKIMMGRRRNETEDLIRDRYGGLPGTDDQDLLLRLWAWSNPYSRDPAKDLHAFGERLGTPLSDAEVEATIAYVQRHPRRFSAKTFGKHIGLTTAEWLRHRPTTMTPFDAKPKELERMRRAINTERQRKRRRQEGAKPRAEYLAAVKGVPATKPAGGRPTIGDKAMTDAERAKRYRAKSARHETVRVEHLTSITGHRQFRDGRKRKETATMKRDTSLRTLPSSPGGKAPTVRVRTAEDAFARQRAEVVDAESVYGELPLELRLMALGLASPGSTAGAARRRKAA